MRRAKYILCMFLMVHAISLAGQSRSDLRSMFVSAEGDLLFEDYAEALPKYLSLLQMFPDNYNLYYRVGQCYLNTPGEKGKSIEWLETAVKNIDPDYRAGRLSEKGAPRDALYHLANAYRIAYKFDRALETYEIFLKDADTEKYDTTLVRFQMQSCHNAREMMQKPAEVDAINLGAPVNDRFSEFNPVVSADENTLLFTRELPFYDAIFWSRKADGKWTEPVNMTPQLGVDQDYCTSSLSPDGRTLLMYRTDTYDGNIYMSRLHGDTWGNVEKLNGNINTKYWESHATMSCDGKKIYFTSNRRESLGGLDIFVSARDSSGNWGPAANLGPGINTVYNEETPFLTNNDSTLFFSSRGHYNMGGYDIFRSDLDENGRWSTPVNIGYPLNTTDDDLFFAPLGDGNRGYYAKFSDDGLGRMDIYSCDIYSELNPRSVTAKETGTKSATNDKPSEEILAADTFAALTDSLIADTLASRTDSLIADTLASRTESLTADTPAAQTYSLAASVRLPADPDVTDPIRNELYDSTDSLTLTDSLINNTGIMAEEEAAGLTARDVKPLDEEIPERTTGENPQGAIAPEAPEKSAANTRSETIEATDRSASTAAAEPAEATAAAEEAVLSAADTKESNGDNLQTAPGGKRCCLWWLLALPVLLFFFLVWIRRKKKKENDSEQ